MADPVYGEVGKNIFHTDPNVGKSDSLKQPSGSILKGRKYSLTITKKDATRPGLITIYRGNKKIGTINQKTQKFIASPEADQFELFHFNQTKAIKNVRSNAENVVSLDLGSEILSVERNAIIQETVYGTLPTDEIRQQIAEQVLNKANADIVDIPQLNIEGEGRPEYGNYYYPLALADGSTGQDRIKFTMKKPKGTKVDPFFYKNNKQFKRTYDDIKGSVTLPIQPVISDKNTVDFAGLQLNAIDAALAGSSYNLASSGSVDELFDRAGKIGNDLKDVLIGPGNRDVQKGLQVFLAQQAAGVQGLLSRTTGAVLNPNLELLFRGPQLRPFSFTFTLSPRNRLESIQTRNIIRFFKQGMSVKTTASNVFLKSPHVFDINYKTFDRNGTEKTHPSINLIKTCALVDCGVEYTPDGSYMTFNDEERTMTSYKISLQFTELDPVYDKEYNAHPAENFIGY